MKSRLYYDGTCLCQVADITSSFFYCQYQYVYTRYADKAVNCICSSIFGVGPVESCIQGCTKTLDGFYATGIYMHGATRGPGTQVYEIFDATTYPQAGGMSFTCTNVAAPNHGTGTSTDTTINANIYSCNNADAYISGTHVSATCCWCPVNYDTFIVGVSWSSTTSGGGGGAIGYDLKCLAMPGFSKCYLRACGLQPATGNFNFTVSYKKVTGNTYDVYCDGTCICQVADLSTFSVCTCNLAYGGTSFCWACNSQTLTPRGINDVTSLTTTSPLPMNSEGTICSGLSCCCLAFRVIQCSDDVSCLKDWGYYVF